MISRRNQGKFFGDHDIALGAGCDPKQPGRHLGRRDD